MKKKPKTDSQIKKADKFRPKTFFYDGFLLCLIFFIFSAVKTGAQQVEIQDSKLRQEKDFSDPNSFFQSLLPSDIPTEQFEDAVSILGNFSYESSASTDFSIQNLLHPEAVIEDLPDEDRQNLMEAVDLSASKTALLFRKMTNLQKQLSALTDRPGEIWNIYIQVLNTNSVVSMGNQQIYAASLSKLFVMDYWKNVLSQNFSLLDAENFSPRGSLRTLLTNMIEISDNDSYNELIRCMSDDGSFENGCQKLNAFLEESGYTQTGIFHTLHPTTFSFTTISEKRNYTTVSDCAALLKKIYSGNQDGDPVSVFMMDLLLHQNNRTKIPAGLPKEITSANKTGETDTVQHDTAIVFGPNTDYILCVMSTDFKNEGDAIDLIQKISSEVFYGLNS